MNPGISEGLAPLIIRAMKRVLAGDVIVPSTSNAVGLVQANEQPRAASTL
jgi:hypothetical protein